MTPAGAFVKRVKETCLRRPGFVKTVAMGRERLFRAWDDGDDTYIFEKGVSRHLESPAMLTILPWQDWVSMDAELRRENPQEERINVPANSRHYWRYRMHLSLEELLKADRLNGMISRKIKESGR